MTMKYLILLLLISCASNTSTGPFAKSYVYKIKKYRGGHCHAIGLGPKAYIEKLNRDDHQECKIKKYNFDKSVVKITCKKPKVSYWLGKTKKDCLSDLKKLHL